MGVRFLVDLVDQARGRAAPNQLEMHALTNLDLVSHVQDGYHFVNSDFRPVAMVLLGTLS